MNNTGELTKLTKCDKSEWDKKSYHASDIPFEWSHN